MENRFSHLPEKDQKLIEKAYNSPSVEWQEVRSLANEAETDEAKEIIIEWSKSLYHKDEYSAGNL